MRDIRGFVQLIQGTYRSNKPVNITGVDKIHSKSNCIQGSIVNAIREPILYSFAIGKPPGHKIFEEPRIKIFEKINKSVLSHITFYPFNCFWIFKETENDDVKTFGLKHSANCYSTAGKDTNFLQGRIQDGCFVILS